MDYASAAFQNIVTEILHGISRCFNLLDNTIVYGNIIQEHDERLHAVLTPFIEHGVLLQVAKCYLGKSEMEFNGHVMSDQGIKSLVPKIEAIFKAHRPENVKQLQSYIGEVNYYLRCIPMLSNAGLPAHTIKLFLRNAFITELFFRNGLNFRKTVYYKEILGIF